MKTSTSPTSECGEKVTSADTDWGGGSKDSKQKFAGKVLAKQIASTFALPTLQVVAVSWPEAVVESC